MPMATVLIVALMVGAWALVSASQQWTARRDAYALAAAAARAGAQGDAGALRAGGLLDPDGAVQRANRVLAAAGRTGSVRVDGAAVAVTVTTDVDYAFPSPGFPHRVTGTASAVAVRGVASAQGG
jgi:hypothetical protein